MAAGATSANKLVLNFSVNSNAPAGAIPNTATVACSCTESNTNNNTANASITVVLQPDLQLTKTASGPTFNPGNSLKYTFQANNTAGGATTGSSTITITDPIPAGTTYQSLDASSVGTWNCSAGPLASGNTVTCTNTDTMAAGATSANKLVLNFSVNSNAPAGAIPNTATVACSCTESNTNNNTANASINVVLTPVDLIILKTANGSAFNPAQTVTFTLTPENIGQTASSGVITVSDTLPAGLTFTAGSFTGTNVAWTCGAPAGQTVSCTTAQVIAGSTGSAVAVATPLTFTALVGSTLGTLTNNTIVSGGGQTNTGCAPGNDCNSVSINVALPSTGPPNTPDMTITKSHTGTMYPGQTGFTYTIGTSNVGILATNPLVPVQVTDTLPAGLTATAIAGTGWTCTLSTLTCTRTDTLAPTASFPPITVTVNVATTVTGTLINNAVVGGGGETNILNDYASDPTVVTPGPDMTITKSHTGNFAPGQVGGTYTIGTSNVGQLPTVGTVTVTDTLPAGMTATAIAGAGWTCTLGTLSCTRADVLAVGAAYPAITVTVNVALTATGTLTNTAVVGGGGEVNLTNDTATDPTIISGLPDMTITKSHTTNFTAGGVGTYVIGTSNVGPTATKGTVTVTDSLPAGLTATAISGSGWTCSLSPLACSRGDVLAAGAAYPAINVTVSIATTATGTLVNTAVVGGGGETNLLNDTATDPVMLLPLPLPDMTITKSHTGAFVPGQSGIWTIVASNLGPASTNGIVTVTDTLPAGFTATAIAGSGWTCTLSPLACNRADVLAATVAYPAITVTVSIPATATGTYTNTAVVGGGGETNLTNDTATDPVTVAGLPDMTITKSHAGTTVRGGTVTYSMVASNVGGTPTTGTVTVTDTLPTGLVANTIAGTGWTCALSTLVCTRTDVLAPGAAYPAIALTATIAGNAPSTVINTAVVGGGGETNLTNDTATDPATLTGGAPNLGIVKTHSGNFVQGGSGTYSLTITNNGTATTTGAVFASDPLPTGLTATGITGVGWTCDVTSLQCTRSDVLAPGASYPPVLINVNIASNAPANLTNVALVTGGGSPPGLGGTPASDQAAIAQLAPTLTLLKTADRRTVEFGDVIGYTLTINNKNTITIQNTVAQDVLPRGFVYVVNSARMTNSAGASTPIDPGNTPGQLNFNIGALMPGQSVTVTYRVRVTASAHPGDNVNTAQLVGVGPGNIGTASAPTGISVTVTPGFLTMKQFIIGRVFEDANGNGIYDPGERPVAGVRIYLSNGQSANTDTKGMYNIPSVAPGSVTVLIDPATIPKGYTISSGGRLEAEDWSRLQRTPLQGGMMLRQNFGLKRCPYCSVVEDTVAAKAAPGGGPVSQSAPQRLAIAPAQESMPADGRSSMSVEVRLLDGNGVPVPAKEIRIRTSLGQFLSEGNTKSFAKAANKIDTDPAKPMSLFGNNSGPQMGQTIEQVPQRLQADAAASPMGVAKFTLIAPSTPGTAQLIAESGDPEHLITTSFEVTFNPEKRSPILASVGEITVGKAAADYDIYQQSGIVSRHADAFLRTPLGDGNMLTMAYTSHLAINDSAGNAGLFQLDPLDRVYQVFGDSSTQFAAAQSDSHVYGRLDHGQSYVMFGDLRMGTGQTSGPQTPAPQTFGQGGAQPAPQASSFGIGDYNRSLVGAAIHVEDKKHDSITVEGARPNTAFARDVFPGSTFGLIQLTHPAILPNSDTASLEVRDRHNPEILLSTDTLVRSVDYSLDPATGAVFFLRSLNAYDQSLNLIQVVFTYEYQTVGLTSSVYAIRTEQRIQSWGTRLNLGVTDQRDSTLGSYYLADVNLTQKLPKAGQLTIEVPVSHGSALAAGASSSALGSIPTNVNGTAVRAELSQPIGWLSGKIQASMVKADSEFFNPFGATVLPGSQTSRGSIEVKPFEKSKLKLTFTDERNKTTLVNNQRQTASIEWKQILSPKFILTAGYDYRDYQDAIATSQSEHADMLSAGLDWKPMQKLTASVRREQNVEGSDPTYPNETLLSARYQATETVRLFLTQRFASAPIVPIGDLSGTGFSALNGKNETAIGVEDKWSRYTTIQSSYLIQNGINSTDSYAVIGLMNRIPLNEKFNIEVGLQRGELITGKDASFNAGSVGFTWMPKKSVRWSTRYELRDMGGLGQIFTTGVAGRIADGLTALGRVQYSNAAFGAGSSAVDVMNPQAANPLLSTLNSALLGTAALAWRPFKREKEGILFSYTLRNTSLNGDQSTLPQNDHVNLLSTDAFYELNKHVEFYNKFAWSGRSYNYVGADSTSTNTFLWQGRVQVKIRRRWDAAYEARIIEQSGVSLNEWTMAVEGGFWLTRDLRAGVGYSFKSADYIAANFLMNPVKQGPYFVLSSKLSNMFNLFAPLDCGCKPPVVVPAPKPVANVQVSAITGAHDVCPGENLRLGVTASGWLPDQTPLYQWYLNDRLVEGANGAFLVAPTAESGTRSVKVTVSAGGSSKTSESVTYMVKRWLPPTVTLSALPLTIPYGDKAQLTSGSTGSECTDPVTVRYTASEGALTGLTFDSTPMQFDMTNRSKPQSKVVHFTAVATDKVGQTATATADITVTLTPAPQRLDDVVFAANSSRVNNCGKRLLLEELTPMLRSDPGAKVILIGHRDNGEKSVVIDNDRVINAAAVLSAGSGICPTLDLSRILVKAAGTDQASQTRPALCGSSVQERNGDTVSANDARAQFRRVEIWFVPSGAPMPAGLSGLGALPEKDVKAKGCPR